ncbi:DoxX family protein [Streptomyces sp. NBC_01304]|uniref:DoxX family protein n=1 Tax=Streptomyces sp. NBC_01304 TaxID=2903818 RepID=UPI002E12263C|nr:DoxX family protein [Streptomyces sp. NBC_01304]
MSATTTLPAGATRTAATAAAPVRSRKATIGLRTLTIALALFMGVGSGLPKLFAASAAVEGFDKIGFGDWYMYFVGGLEVAGAIALLIPILSGVSAMAFVGLMVGATITTITAMGGEFWYSPVILIIPFVVIARAQRHQTVRLVKLLRQVRRQV